MATERLEPDVLVASSGLTGSVSDIQADPDVKVWSGGANLRATSNNTSTSIHCSFGSPSGNLTGQQEFRVLLRPFDSGQTGDPDWRIELWEFEASVWSLVRAGSNTEILNDAGDTVASFTWDVSELTTVSGANVGIKVFGVKSGGSPSTRNTVDIGAVEWNVAYTEPSADTEVLANTDVLTLAEQSASTLFDVGVAATVAVLAITTFAAGIGLDTNVNAQTDALSLTENQASVSLGVDVQAGTDALTITNQQASITYGVGVGANSATLTLTANQASISFDVNVLATTDALILTTHRALAVMNSSIDTKEKRANVIGVGRPYLRDKFPIATPDQEWRISSGNAYGGNALTEVDTNVLANTDALTLTEQTAGVALDVDISASTDALTLTEQQAGIAVDVGVSASTDALTLVEQAASIALDVNVTSGADALTLTTYQATVQLGVNIDATTDALTLTEQTATIAYDVTVSASTDSLTLTEYAATIAAIDGAGPAAVRILASDRQRRIIAEPRRRRFLAEERIRRFNVYKLN